MGMVLWWHGDHRPWIAHNDCMSARKSLLRICICSVGLLAATAQPQSIYGQKAGGQEAGASPAAPPAASKTAPDADAADSAAPMSDEDKANALSDQVGKLMLKCVNLLTAGDPLALDYCKQQRDLAEQYPEHLRAMDKMMAHDEYGIALAAFDRKNEALDEFDREIVLLPQAAKLGSKEWSTAYWHRAMVYSEMGQSERADRDYRAAEESLRKHDREEGAAHAGQTTKAVLRQHAALLQKEGKTEMAQRLLEEAAK
jgi:tetratricopeptide (TPR) repeat protein